MSDVPSRRRFEEEGFEEDETFDLDFDEEPDARFADDGSVGPFDLGSDEELLDLPPVTGEPDDERLGLFDDPHFDHASSGDEYEAPFVLTGAHGDEPMSDEELGLTVSVDATSVLSASEELGIEGDTDAMFEDLALPDVELGASDDDLFEGGIGDYTLDADLSIEPDSIPLDPGSEPPPPRWAPLGLEEPLAGQ